MRPVQGRDVRQQLLRDQPTAPQAAAAWMFLSAPGGGEGSLKKPQTIKEGWNPVLIDRDAILYHCDGQRQSQAPPQAIQCPPGKDSPQSA